VFTTFCTKKCLPFYRPSIKANLSNLTLLSTLVNIMASKAQWLPVLAIPEEPLVALMRDDVIYHLG
jgi:hypothetical protein